MRRSVLFVFCVATAGLFACEPTGGSEDDAADSVEETGEDATTADGEVSEDATLDVVEVDPTTLRVRFDPEGEGFYRTPWPSDARLTEAGTPDLMDYPGVQTEIVVAYREEIQRAAKGYSNMPVIYVEFDQAVSPDNLVSALTTETFTSPLQLIDLSEAGCGERVPLAMQINDARDNYINANVLQMAPEIGAALVPGRTYGAVVLKTFGRAAGQVTARPEAFDAALLDASGATAESASLDPLRSCVAEMSDLDLEDIAVATVFTTQDPLGSAKQLRDAVMDSALATRPVTDWKQSEAWTRRGVVTTWTGEVEMPIYQEGESPYNTEGGGLVFDESGAPVVQRWESVPIALSMAGYETPRDGEARPILVFLDGTGWRPWWHLRDNWVEEALEAGYVVASFMPQFHGGRGGFEGEPELPSFNFLNAPAGRSNFRQQAAEISFFVRVLREQLPGLDGLPTLDGSALVYGGHSQGALAGALAAAVEGEFKSWIFNGLSSYLSLTIIFRKDITDFAALIKIFFQISRDLDRFHPAIQLFQLGAEVVDTYNYARHWAGSEVLPGGNNVYVVNGAEDATTTQRGMDHLTMMAPLPIIEHADSWDVDPVGVWDAPMSVAVPASGNVTPFGGEGVLTQGTYLSAEGGHGTIYRERPSRELALNFWETSLEGTPRFVMDSEGFCSGGGDEDEDGLVDCEDPDCEGAEACIETACGDGVDNDDNGTTDCEDPSCARRAPCYETSCTDEEDNNEDGLVDCDDPECADRRGCAEAKCGDGEDNDGDGDIDCEDANCANSSLCRERACTDGKDSDGDELVDCDDPDCQGGSTCIEWRCDDEVDNDENGLVDCEDPACVRDPEACPLPVEDCGNGVDDDGNGDIDCDDSKCALDATCADLNTTCADADLGTATGYGVISFTTTEESPSSWIPGPCVSLGYGEASPDVSFHWTAPETGVYTLSTLGSNVDTTIYAYPADCEGIEFGCDDDDRPRETSLLNLSIDAGVSTVIVVSGYDTEDFGDIILNIYPRP